MNTQTNDHFKIMATVALLGVFGCGSSTGPELAPVTGRLTQDGMPVAGALVEFIPASGRPSFARTDDDGSFEMTQGRAMQGVVPGKHRVSVTVETTAGPRMADDGTMLAPIPRQQSGPPIAVTLPEMVDVSEEGLEDYEIDVSEIVSAS